MIKLSAVIWLPLATLMSTCWFVFGAMSYLAARGPQKRPSK
jgi:hypothetical protein